MKKVFFTLISFFVIVTLSCGQDEIPPSAINVGVGFGVPFGGLGAKTVLGPKNSGLLLGFGVLPGSNKPGFMLGVQLSRQVIFIDIGYGRIGTYQINDQKTKTVEAGIVLIGGMIPIGSPKRLFMDLSMGASFGDRLHDGHFEFIRNTFQLALGLGYRIGNTDK
ncbi:MAG: hypothetical protein KQI35_16735 [Bacteroidetes bacterium]|nr:hypothetical protein [Bacteroidota bacterium]